MKARPVGGTSKRLFDLAAGGALLLLTSPLLILTALAVRLTSRGPIFHRAGRAGVEGEPFDLWKFRSMRLADESEGRKITEAEDSRITGVGWFLRTTKLDELPQLLNILRGEMSLVGPRPEELPVLESHYPEEVRREILAARPGLTGLLQVKVFPDMTNEIIPAGMDPQEFYFRDQLPRRVAVDLHYVRHWSLGMDLGILARTVWCVALRAPLILAFGRPRVRHSLPPVEDEGLLRLFAEHWRGERDPGGRIPAAPS